MRLLILFIPFTLSAEGITKSYKSCINKSSEKYKVPKILIEIIINDLESGRVGDKNFNNNKTFDMGLMQINSIHLKELSKFKIYEKDLINDACINIDVGTWILAKEIKRTGNFALGLASYHSRTKKHANAYLNRAIKAIKKY